MDYSFYQPISNIKLNRRRLHMSQEQLAQGICSRQSIIKFETGLAAPSERLARKLADRLQISPGSFAMAAKYDREQIALIKQVTLEKDCETLERICNEMLDRATTKIAREHWHHRLQICEKLSD